MGATVASMFPDRIDKLILDGVQNPHEYYHAQAYVPLHLVYVTLVHIDTNQTSSFTATSRNGPNQTMSLPASSKPALPQRNIAPYTAPT